MCAVAPAITGGTVLFVDGTTALTGVVAVTNGTATINHTFATAGTHVVVAFFSGVTNQFNSSFGSLTVNVKMGLNLGSACIPLG